MDKLMTEAELARCAAVIGAANSASGDLTTDAQKNLKAVAASLLEQLRLTREKLADIRPELIRIR